MSQYLVFSQSLQTLLVITFKGHVIFSFRHTVVSYITNQYFKTAETTDSTNVSSNPFETIHNNSSPKLVGKILVL